MVLEGEMLMSSSRGLVNRNRNNGASFFMLDVPAWWRDYLQVDADMLSGRTSCPD